MNNKSALILNYDQDGMYHVAYDERNWKNIGGFLKRIAEKPEKPLIPAPTRIHLLWSLKRSVKRKEIKPSMLLCVGEYITVSSKFMFKIMYQFV